MPTGAAKMWAGRWGPEWGLAVLATLVFLGFLGSVDLWGKREQRSAAETIDTLDQGHWLVAQIQSRPRLEKPPLPRWMMAGLMRLTGRRDEAIVRLPSALAALATVGLVYAFGRRLGDRAVGLSAGLALTSMGFFISELRQAGNDGPLACFTTLALYAAWRRLHGDGTEVGDTPGARRWNLVMYFALGLGFLTKGPIILVLVALTVVAYLATVRKLRPGLGRLVDGWGLLLFVVLASSWPVPVLLSDPNAAQVWLLEMGQKAGSAGAVRHKTREVLAADWPWMTAPWVLIAMTAVVVPLTPRGRESRPRIWFPWWWSVGNLAMFCLWSVAKPNYYLPCLPGMAVLIGMEWVRLTRLARESGPLAVLPRRLLQFHWVVLFAGGLIAPLVVRQVLPEAFAWSVAMGALLAIGVPVSALAWRRGADAGALAPLVAALAGSVLIGYGVLAPQANSRHSHRALAATLDRILPPETRTIMFFRELDEGLWFYLRDRTLVPVPGSLPKYNAAVGLVEESKENRLELDWRKRAPNEIKVFRAWSDRADRPSSFVLMRAKDYDMKYAAGLAGCVREVYREHGLKRNEVVLLQVVGPRSDPVAAGSEPPASARR